MLQNKLELIVTFARLWGIATGDDFDIDGKIYIRLEAYEPEELIPIFSSWADEFLQGDFDDAGDFFDEKLSSLISSFAGASLDELYPVLYGYAGEVTKELRGVQEVAEFIMEYGLENDITITREGHVFFLNTFGIYINRIADMVYRDALLKVLVPMQKAVDGSEKI